MKIKKKNEESADKKPRKSMIFNIRLLLIIWGAVMVLVVAAYFISKKLTVFNPDATFPLMSIIISFAAFAVSSLFSFSILNHNAILRDANDELKKNSDDVNARAEAFRTLQFIASNYTIVDFTDYIVMYDEPERYVGIFKSNHDFTFYMREDDVSIEDVNEHPENYRFITVKIPFTIVEGKTIGKVKFARFKFSKDGKDHRFVNCGRMTNSLILYNEQDHRSEALVNLIMRKGSEFYKPGAVNPFLKIKINLTMVSLLGVAVTGWIELYFTNPERLESDGSSKYKINSSQFEVSGLPQLLSSVNEDIKTL